MPEQQVFNLQEGERLKDVGMYRAASRSDLLYIAKEVAEKYASWHGEVTSDEVYKILMVRDYDPRTLGNAAGSIFKGKQWECIGWRKSTRSTNHARAIRIWRLK